MQGAARHPGVRDLESTLNQHCPTPPSCCLVADQSHPVRLDQINVCAFEPVRWCGCYRETLPGQLYVYMDTSHAVKFGGGTGILTYAQPHPLQTLLNSLHSFLFTCLILPLMLEPAQTISQSIFHTFQVSAQNIICSRKPFLPYLV